MFCSVSCFFNEISLTKFARVCEQKLTVTGKVCNACGRLPGDCGPRINQSERAYYRSHLIMSFKPVTSFTVAVVNYSKVPFDNVT